RWALGGRLGYYGSQSDRDIDTARNDLTTSDITTDDGRSTNEFHGTGGSLQATYQRDQKNKGTISVDSYSGTGDSTQITDRVTNLTPVFHQQQQGQFDYNYNRIGLQFQHDGATPRQQLRLDSELWSDRYSNERTIAVDPVSDPPPSPFLSRNGASI